MSDQFVIKFDYNIELINKLVAEVKALDVSNIDSVREYHKQLVKVRTTIKKQEAEMVEGANKFRKDVFAKREEYLSITEPVEESLKQVIEADEKRKIIEARSTLLPMKKQQLAMLEVTPVSDSEILEMDEEQWVAYYNECSRVHFERLEAKKRAEAEAKERAEREERIKKEAEERAEKERELALKKAEEDKANALKKAEADKIKAVEDAKREMEQKALKEKADAEDKARKEKEKAEAEAKAKKLAEEKLEADKKYQDFLKANSFDATTDIIQRNGSETIIYRKVAVFNSK